MPEEQGTADRAEEIQRLRGADFRRRESQRPRLEQRVADRGDDGNLKAVENPRDAEPP